MAFSEEIKETVKELSVLIRQLYGIREREQVSYKEHPLFVKDVIHDLTNISQNLAIADRIISEQEIDLFQYAVEKIFYANGSVNYKFIQSINHRFKTYKTEEPEIKSPVLVLERAKRYDAKQGTETEPIIRAHLVTFAEAMVMSDGFESVGEFDVLETFKTWVNGEG